MKTIVWVQGHSRLPTSWTQHIFCTWEEWAFNDRQGWIWNSLQFDCPWDWAAGPVSCTTCRTIPQNDQQVLVAAIFWPSTLYSFHLGSNLCVLGTSNFGKMGNAPFLSTYSYIWSLILYPILFLKTTWSVCFFQFQWSFGFKCWCLFLFQVSLEKGIAWENSQVKALSSYLTPTFAMWYRLKKTMHSRGTWYLQSSQWVSIYYLPTQHHPSKFGVPIPQECAFLVGWL